MASILLFAVLCALPRPGQEHVEAGSWKVVGPFRGAQAPSTNSRLAPETLFADAQVDVPWSGLLEDFPRRNGDPLRWRPARLDAPERLAAVDPLAAHLRDVGKVLPELDAEDLRARGNAVYLYRPIDSSEAREIEVHYGADGGLRMWLNGRQVAKDDKPRDFDAWSDRASLPLQRGRNHLLVKLVHDGDPWRFAMGSATELAHRVGMELVGASLIPGDPQLGARVNGAIEAGVAHLLELRNVGPDALRQGRYRGNYPRAVAAFSAYTLMKCGVPPNRDEVARALDEARRSGDEGTYSTALRVMALALGQRDEDRNALERLVKRLVSTQASSGLWGYPSGSPDLSNTQYAALGLQAAVEAGVDVPREVWRNMARGVLACRAASGNRSSSGRGFSYHPGSRSASPTMTAAGIATLVLCRDHVEGSRQRASMTSSIDSALVPLGDGEALLKGNGYSLYSLERVGGFLKQDQLGGRNWYRHGLDLHLDPLMESGWATWSAKRSYGTELETCFMLLFLRRASSGGAVLRRPVTPSSSSDASGARRWKSDPAAGALVLRASLEGVPSMWLDATSPAFSDLQRVVYWVQPPAGEWQRIDDTDGHRYAAPLPCDREGTWQLRASGFLTDGKSVASGILEIDWPPAGSENTED